MSKTKVWIIGAKGRLGSTISDALDRMEYNVLTSDRSGCGYHRYGQCHSFHGYESSGGGY